MSYAKRRFVWISIETTPSFLRFIENRRFNCSSHFLGVGVWYCYRCRQSTRPPFLRRRYEQSPRRTLGNQIQQYSGSDTKLGGCLVEQKRRQSEPYAKAPFLVSGTLVPLEATCLPVSCLQLKQHRQRKDHSPWDISFRYWNRQCGRRGGGAHPSCRWRRRPSLAARAKATRDKGLSI